jgi:Cdc6-like AAA superfamily ATPase
MERQEVTVSVAQDIQEAKAIAIETNERVGRIISAKRQDDVHTWLSPCDPSTNYNKALGVRHENSSQWFLESPAYTSWRTQPSSFLWLKGKPGCGKTIISATAIENLQKTGSRTQTLLYFYFDFNNAAKQSLEDMVRSLVYQLYRQTPGVQMPLDLLYSDCESGKSQPSTDSLCTAFQRMMELAGEVWIVLDALDECPTREEPVGKGLLAWIQDLAKKDVHLLTTSRPEQDIESSITKLAQAEDVISLQSDLVHPDICRYIRDRVRSHEALSRWRGQPDVQEEIESALMEKADGM